MSEELKAEEIVKALIEDLSDRRGLRHEWESIDEDTQEEIRQTWATIISSRIPRTEATGIAELLLELRSSREDLGNALAAWNQRTESAELSAVKGLLVKYRDTMETHSGCYISPSGVDFRCELCKQTDAILGPSTTSQREEKKQ